MNYLTIKNGFPIVLLLNRLTFQVIASDHNAYV